MSVVFSQCVHKRMSSLLRVILSFFHIHCNLQILRSFLGRECFKHASQQAISSMKQHIQNACKLTWGLATAWPPLIVAQPGEFREELHDREFQYWDRSNQSLKLYYTRPVLFHSCEGRVGVKGWVGNRNTVSNSTHPCS